MNNIVKITLSVALFGVLTLGIAEDNSSSSINIDTQIEKIQNSSPSERVKLMNQFKQELSQMNQLDRQAAIEKMQSSMHISNIHTENKNMMEKGKEYKSMKVVNSQEMIQGQQMHMNTHMNQMQNSNQMQNMNQMQNINQNNIQQQNNSSF